MLCCVCCSTDPNAIKSLAGVARPIDEYPSPRKDASATALRGAFDISVKILKLYVKSCLYGIQRSNIRTKALPQRKLLFFVDIAVTTFDV